MGRINCFIPFVSQEQAAQTIEHLKSLELVNKIYLLATVDKPKPVEGCEMLPVNVLFSSATMREIAAHADADYVLLYTKYDTLKMAPFALERFAKLGDDTLSGMLYVDHYNVTDKGADKAPVIDYQMGSLRDDFDFGSVMFFCSQCFKKAVEAMKVPLVLHCPEAVFQFPQPGRGRTIRFDEQGQRRCNLRFVCHPT